jgi:hypothetical protein
MGRLLAPQALDTFSLDDILTTQQLNRFQDRIVKITAVHAKCDFQPLFFEVSYDFLDHFCCAVCRMGISASDIASQVGLDFITESKLDVGTAVSGLLTFYCPLLMALDIDHTAVDIEGDGYRFRFLGKWQTH